MTCLRCGISRPTLRKWYRRYKAEGVEGLKGKSRSPKSSPARKTFDPEKEKILSLRSERKLGARRIQNELRRLYKTRLALATIHKVLSRSGVAPLRKRREKIWNRYSRPIPGDRVQMDTCKIGRGLYQYTAIDDCTRYMVVGLYPRRTAENTIRFLEERVFEEMPFPVQRIQTDRGGEFFAYKVQDFLREAKIKFRPVRPRSPHLNGKVERAQRTVLDEFYDTVDIKRADLNEELDQFQHYYNWERAHGAHNGKTPMDRYFDESQHTPFWEEVQASYDPSREFIRYNNYRIDLKAIRFKGDYDKEA
jgi:transposase InsO family protein